MRGRAERRGESALSHRGPLLRRLSIPPPTPPRSGWRDRRPGSPLTFAANGISLWLTKLANAEDDVTEYLDRAGNTLAYEVTGQGPLVVLAHGIGGSRHSYRILVPALAGAGYRVASG